MTYKTVAIILIGDVRECDIINHMVTYSVNFRNFHSQTTGLSILYNIRL